MCRKTVQSSSGPLHRMFQGPMHSLLYMHVLQVPSRQDGTFRDIAAMLRSPYKCSWWILLMFIAKDNVVIITE